MVSTRTEGWTTIQVTHLKGEIKMKLTPPKVITWWIALILGVLGLLGFLGVVASLGQYAFWLVAAGLALMLIATLVKNL
jgi:4-hydroxybenzoate polyprenyltransferase